LLEYLEKEMNVFYLIQNNKEKIVLNGHIFYYDFKLVGSIEPMISLSKNTKYKKWFYVKNPREIKIFIESITNEPTFYS
jgi:hypothetical protein